MEQKEQGHTGEEDLPLLLVGDFGDKYDGKEDREGERDVERHSLHIDGDIELEVVALTVDISQRDLVFDGEYHLLALDTALDGDELIVGGYEMEGRGGDEEVVVSLDIDPTH